MPAPPDRQIPDLLERVGPHPWPLPPLNVFVSSSFRKQSIDIRWDSPSPAANSCFNVLGVNVYRSFDSEYGPYERLNVSPIGGNFWRDQTDVALVLQEDVTNSFSVRGVPDDTYGRWLFQVRHQPIVVQPVPGAPNCCDLNVQVTIDGVHAAVSAVHGAEGIVELSNRATFDVTNQVKSPPVLPQPGQTVLASYRYLRNQVRTDLGSRIFYRITTVAFDTVRGVMVETPIERGSQASRNEIEKNDYIWREALRRSKWILNQGGERLKVFVRKTSGIRCGCTPTYHKSPSSTCEVCYGTGWIGGYEGPYDIIVSPDDSPKNIRQTNRGRTLDHVFESWTMPSPALSQRDFVVRKNGDRYGIGSVRMPSNRGNELLQFFSLSHIDEQDIRYLVPIPDPHSMRSPETRWIVPGEGSSLPMQSDKVTIPDERQVRSATVTGENINY